MPPFACFLVSEEFYYVEVKIDLPCREVFRQVVVFRLRCGFTDNRIVCDRNAIGIPSGYLTIRLVKECRRLVVDIHILHQVARDVCQPRRCLLWVAIEVGVGYQPCDVAVLAHANDNHRERCLIPRLPSRPVKRAFGEPFAQLRDVEVCPREQFRD